MIDTQSIIQCVYDEKMIAILRGVREDWLLKVADTLYEGGIRMMECTFDHADSDCIRNNCRKIEMLTKHFGGLVHIGAGTVLKSEEVDATIDAGGTFMISPNVDTRVIGRTRELGAVSIPGALTPTEIVDAWNAGAHFVKIFPAGSFGPKYIKAIRAPLKHIPMLAVGGIECSEMKDYLAAGVCGFGMGTQLLPKEFVESLSYPRLALHVRAYVDAAKGLEYL